jgi:hypothetical protein
LVSDDGLTACGALKIRALVASDEAEKLSLTLSIKNCRA